MGGIAVIYKSKYGTTKQYAQWIAGELGAVLLEASAVKPSQLASFDVVVYGGGLYAGGIAGVKLITDNPCKSLVLFTVGLADPETTDYSAILDKNLTQELCSKTKIFHLRGGINYKNLSLIHKVMMGLKRKLVLKKDQAELSEESQDFLKTYGSKVYFTDENAIEPILAYVRGL